MSIPTSFVNEIKTEFGKTIKILRSDNAKEYFSSAISSFLSAQGILHQFSCPHTPQQNDIAERKNRHLVETARTLLLHANVPVQHWGDTVLTAFFFINRMPSSSIKNKISHSILFPKEPLFHVDPRIFGCTVLFINCLEVLISLLLKPSNVFSLDIPDYRKVADVTLLFTIIIMSLQM